jgi:hypothetical protein
MNLDQTREAIANLSDIELARKLMHPVKFLDNFPVYWRNSGYLPRKKKKAVRKELADLGNATFIFVQLINDEVQKRNNLRRETESGSTDN